MVSRLSLRHFVMLCGLSLALVVPIAAPAQIGSDSYQFIEAIKKVAKGDDGEPAKKAQDFVNEPGSTLINTRERSTNRTALHYMAESNRLDWAGYLLGRGAKTDFKDKDGNTPLMLATLRRGYETAELLLKVGARVDESNNNGETPLIAAVHASDVRLMRMLLDKGANADRPDTSSGYSAREQAARNTRAPQLLRAIEENDKKPKKAKMGP
ncbi:ankyrin repeat domain-containing protein [Sphingobium boeckii]|uniref:Ankyrin repeat protein n=1 Tax=Sphingobium boeckii TaxID=1082345 RepID=A0A7W9ECB3_9SPHN|nr:ankyrin repeat domain-containing protein [Sphingobium boeckii]MBB5684078.1 ankyrin repeat protein [Sphingobium boeckii]